jgi:adenylate cyclase
MSDRRSEPVSRDALEIERKFLVIPERLPPLGDAVPIVQAYLGFEPVVRVRLEGGRGVLTVKGRGLRARREVEVEIGAEVARSLLELRAEGTVVVRKARYRVSWGGKIWEIDRFEAPFEGLLLAEVELEGPEEQVALPPWAGEEVTDGPAYQNANLAKRGRVP